VEADFGAVGFGEKLHAALNRVMENDARAKGPKQ
jgi:hypothetical protein